ncbi:Tify [Corchorus olitorius]|uniref:Protein TIFY n=1 Tax=Corchorus olitorius TaxID=93759 RepID=A0A1R3JBQ5_9ROSI|nr:Tify [Corchorus olitorius]
MLDINIAADEAYNYNNNNEHRKKVLKQGDDNGMSQSIDLFRKYLLSKSQNHNVGKTNKEEESEVLKKKSPPPRPLIPLMPPPQFACTNFARPLSLLERKLLPAGTGGETHRETISTSPGKNDSSKAQLTIFYAGVINVYDDVPSDKAQAIMLLAGESSLSKPIANHEETKTEAKIKTPLHLHRPNIESASCKLQATDLPIARKLSLQHFIEKRRRRIVCNSPYAPAAAKKDQEKEINELKSDNNNNSKENNNHNISLSPFPSRLGYFLPVAPNTNRGCQA